MEIKNLGKGILQINNKLWNKELETVEQFRVESAEQLEVETVEQFQLEAHKRKIIVCFVIKSRDRDLNVFRRFKNQSDLISYIDKIPQGYRNFYEIIFEEDSIKMD